MPDHSETVRAANHSSKPLFALASALVPDGETLQSITITAHATIDPPTEQLYRIMYPHAANGARLRCVRAGYGGKYTLRDAAERCAELLCDSGPRYLPPRYFIEVVR